MLLLLINFDDYYSKFIWKLFFKCWIWAVHSFGRISSGIRTPDGMKLGSAALIHSALQ